MQCNTQNAQAHKNTCSLITLRYESRALILMYVLADLLSQEEVFECI
jgi:hypothetical protein